MNTLWAFGDSFTESYNPEQTVVHWRHEYMNWKGYIIKVYPELIAEKLNLKLVNKAIGGCDNSHIFEEFCKVCNKIKKEDIVIFGWTNQQRFRLPNKRKEWAFFNPQASNLNGFFAHKSLNTFDYLSEKTIQEILLIRDSNKCIDELCSWINLINCFLKDVNVIHWSWDLRNNMCGRILISKQYEKIKDETNDVVSDGHWSENGQKEFSEYLINKLIKIDKKKII